MFFDYLNNLRALGKYYFTLQQAMSDLKASKYTIYSAVYRLKKSGDLISPAKGLYVIVPPEHKLQGSIPAEELAPILMKFLKADYYVGLLSAALYYGASHQKPGSFQVITGKRIKHSLHFGHVKIDYVYKQSMKKLPILEIAVRTGYLRISSAELTVMDLFLYPNKSGGLNHIATVLSEMTESLDPEKLIDLAENVKKCAWLQRCGYILEKIDVIDEDHKQKIIDRLADYLSSRKLRFISLASELPVGGFSRSRKWMIIENTTIESD